MIKSKILQAPLLEMKIKRSEQQKTEITELTANNYIL